MKFRGWKIFLISGLTLCTFQMGYASTTTSPSCSKDVAPLLEKLFSSLGHDCDTYVSLFADDAKYYHQHDGYKTYSELPKNCQNYAAFCPGNDCRFLQNGDALVVARGNSCELLVPYLWSEIPGNNKAKGNLEPHTGWEYIVANPDSKSRFGYSMKYFAELETSYSVAFNWADPNNTPDVVAQSTLQLLKTTASKGECDSPIAPTLTQYFNDKSSDRDIWRQQGDAVVLAAGGVCHVTVPYSAQVGAKLKTGQFVFTLQPVMNNSYLINDVVEFPRAVL
jgi:hypothetical protein